jgi:uncharacterized protein
MAKFKFIEWLVDWILKQNSFSFEWDEGNLSKNRQKHGITCEEAESVFLQPEAIRVLGEQVEPETSEPRYGILGMTTTSKPVFMCFTVRGAGVRVISVRVMNRRERILYAELCEE